MFKRENLPAEASIFAVFIGIAVLFEVLGWVFVGKSFLGNLQRLEIIILQVSIFGIIAVGVTQVIITSGIDLSGGAVLALSAMVAASLAQSADAFAPIFPQFLGLPIIIPITIGLLVGATCGWINGAITAYTGIPSFIATLGMLVTARAVAVIYTKGQPVYSLSDSFTAIGAGAWPVLIFFVVAVIFHLVLKHTVYGKHTYAIGSNEKAARVAGINVRRHKIMVYTIAGSLSGLAGVVMCARATIGQSGMGTMYELDAISAVVIGGTSLFGGRGRISGTVIGVCILGVITSGFTFLRIDFYYQEIVKGMIIVGAVMLDQRRQAQQRLRA
ncbi:MAG: ABC transporter permease [Oceanospirillaceae bacterium]|nr:ABC transporter permease [Pseudomonadales bacterium]|tara:strand:- start:5344 stop:6330 length:987 start_codon:yes stop_codon:yes gene_type:complete